MRVKMMMLVIEWISTEEILILVLVIMVFITCETQIVR